MDEITDKEDGKKAATIPVRIPKEYLPRVRSGVEQRIIAITEGEYSEEVTTGRMSKKELMDEIESRTTEIMPAINEAIENKQNRGKDVILEVLDAHIAEWLIPLKSDL